MNLQVLTGETMATNYLERLQLLKWGRMFVEKTPKPYTGEPWGFDNGAFAAWLTGQAFPVDQFRTRLDRAYKAEGAGRPYLAVAPDIVGAGEASLEFSLGWLDNLPKDWPWYLAVQDGMTLEGVSACLDRFAGIFLGGTTRFKSTAATWRVLAGSRGVKFHYARAGTLSRVEAAVAIGADSLDSSLPLWTRARFAEFQGYLGPAGAPQAMLPTLRDLIARGFGDGESDPLTGCAP